MESKTERRRSFVDVQRKSLLFDQLFEEDNENIPCRENTTLTMKQYLAMLKEERMQWKDLLDSRYKQFEGQLKKNHAREATELSASEVEPFLDEEHKTFLNNEPDYLGMLEQADKYLKAVQFLKRYKSDVIEYYNQITEEAELENGELIDNLCRTDRCELCNQVNCNNPDHKYSP